MSETSEVIRQRVQTARNIQQTRFANPNSRNSNIISNADMHIGEIRQYCQLQAEGGALGVSKYQSLMRSATLCCAHGAVRESTTVIRARLCTAQCHRILKLSRTIADLAGSDEIQSTHLAEALQYCPRLMI